MTRPKASHRIMPHSEGRTTVATLVLFATLGGCHLEGRSARAQELLSELAPITLSQSLAQAREAVPALRVHHAGERWTTQFQPDSSRPFLAGVIVNPSPTAGDSASPDAGVEGVEFLLTPAQAAALRARATALLGAPTSLACAGTSISETDSVIDWARDIRGGVLLTIPHRRLSGEPSTARLFFYTSGWDPHRAISGYGVMSCDE